MDSLRAVSKQTGRAIKAAGALVPLILLAEFPLASLANGTSVTSTINSSVTGPVGGDNPTYPLNGEDTLIIEDIGAVTTTNDGTDAIGATGSGNTLNNSGSVRATGSFSDGFYTSGSYSVIRNWGTIETSSLWGNGIWADSADGSNSILNAGSISTAASDASGIFARGNSNSIDNQGSISILGDRSFGIFANGAGGLGNGSLVNIINSGSIITEGATSSAINAYLDSSSISNSGEIRTVGEQSDGIKSSGNSNKIVNTGTILTSGNNAMGVYVAGSGGTITNSGLIQTTGTITPWWPRGAEGIFLIGDNTSISNSGSIITSGGGSDGIYFSGNQNILNNFGLIKTTGDGADGIQILASNSNSIRNTGSIATSGTYSWGLYIQGNDNLIENEGSILSTGDYSGGVAVYGDSNTITNQGSISSAGQEKEYVGTPYGVLIVGSSNSIVNFGTISSNKGYAVYIDGDDNTLTNAGSIISPEGYAVYFSGAGNTLNSLNNFLSGKVNMGSGGTVNITTGANYSKLYTFEGANLTVNGSGTVPLFINSTTQQAGTYDPTIFASSSDALADMTSAISSLTPGRFNGTDKEHPVWARGFGTTSSYSGSYSGADTTLDRNYIFSGVALGIDAVRSKDLVIGFLGGYGQTSLTADAETNQSFNNTSDGGFLGLYGQKRWKSWAFDFALNGGVQSFQQQRYVNNNLAYLGNSSTQASFQGWWIAPELAATVKLAEVKGWSLLPTARLRYAQQWMGGYSEMGGGAANASVSGRNVTIGQSFVGIGTRKTIKTSLGKNTKMVLDGQVGYMYRGAVGDDTVDVTMIGQSLSLPTEISSRNAVAVSAGVALDLSSAVTLKIRGDAAAGGGMNYVGGGWAGLSFKF